MYKKTCVNILVCIFLDIFLLDIKKKIQIFHLSFKIYFKFHTNHRYFSIYYRFIHIIDNSNLELLSENY